MGTYNEFKCPECGYTAEVTDGDDCGIVAMTKTMVCHTCRKLIDVLTVIQPFSKEHDPKIERDISRCPRCHGTDVEEWSSARPPSGRGERDLF